MVLVVEIGIEMRVERAGSTRVCVLFEEAEVKQSFHPFPRTELDIIQARIRLLIGN